MGKGLSRSSGTWLPLQSMGQPDDPLPKNLAKTGELTCVGQANGSTVAQAPQLAATWIVGDITERLASRVKGLTDDFCILLLTLPAAACVGTGACVDGCGKKSLVQMHEILRG
jgi:hypothetical protein